MVEPASARDDKAAAEFDFVAFFRLEYPRLVALAIALSGRRAVAEELAQEALLRAYRAWPSVSSLDRPGAWARRVTINLAISAQRRLRSEAEALDRLDRRPVATATLDGDHRYADRFWLAVRGLPARQRAAVALHYLEDRPVDEVAQVLGCAPGTVKAQLHKARATLARVLAPTEEES